ncbi:MAG TPA: thioesterase family protein [Pseudonocardiaceae bacterium]|nr:thioesterase family protein [Pseudonocardiaceae bacterium]
MIEQAFFGTSGEEFLPAPHARSWWAASMLHGRLLGGLMARSTELAHGEDGLRVSRLTVDLFRNAPMSPVRVRTERIRDGRRIRVVEATAYVGDMAAAKATAVLLRQSTQPDGEVPATQAWDAPPPEALPAVRSRFPPQTWRFTEHNDPARHWSAQGNRRLWMRETCPLVDGEPLSPLVRAALAADSASPLAHASDVGLEYINADYTLYLSRLPVGDTIGLESGGHTSAQGIAVGHCTMHDRTGPIGYAMTTAIANPGVKPPRRRAADLAEQAPDRS